MDKRIKVFIDSSPLETGHAVRGVGHYTRNLIDVLKEQKQITLVEISQDADIIHYPFFDLFFQTLPIQKSKPTVVTIHDVIPLLYPQQYDPGLRGLFNFSIQKLSLQGVSAIITDSETSRKDIVRFLGVKQEKVHTVHLAPADIYTTISKNSTNLVQVRKKYRLPEKFVLYTGDVNYNKNTLNLVKACESIKVPLVICGKQALEIENTPFIPILSGPRDWMRYIIGIPHPEHAHFQDLLKAFQSDNVIRLGYVPDEDLVVIYNLASVYCQPSLYEGFGLPVLEAFVSGCPVVAAKTQALVEVAGSAQLFVDPNKSDDIAHGLLTVLKDEALRESLVKNALQRVKDFSWAKAAQETIAVYQDVV